MPLISPSAALRLFELPVQPQAALRMRAICESAGLPLLPPCSRLLWSRALHAVHVIASSVVKKGAKAGDTVARVTLLNQQTGTTQSYPAALCGADRARDLAVLSINAPPEQLR